MKKYLYFHEHRVHTPGLGEGSQGQPIYAASEQEAWEIARRMAEEGKLTIGKDDIMHRFQRGFLAAHTWLPGEVEDED
ncbi:MAG: hypothetical protein ACRDIV_26700 [Ktedonobacteraceae bacterium]